ncbi:MAG: metallophosphoesterase [Verrucomicrobia bacterium]|nr:metallophosphoesterase [Verrucomicrobiota bacterium]
MSAERLLTRREAVLRLGAASLFGLGLWPGCHTPRATSGGGRAFRFLAVNDLHHASAACDEWFAALVRQMRGHEGIEFVLLLGDLADTGEEADLAAIRDHFRTLRLPFYSVIGNHDYLTATDRRAYEQIFPRQLNYEFEHRGWQFVGIDSTEGTSWEKTRVQPATLRWLDDRLPKLSRHRPLVLFTHFPLGADVRMRPLNADEVLERFLDFNLRGVFGGHFHGYTARRFQNAEVLTNRCCSFLRANHDGTTEKGYWLVTAADGTLAREFIAFKGLGNATASVGVSAPFGNATGSNGALTDVLSFPLRGPG